VIQSFKDKNNVSESYSELIPKPKGKFKYPVNQHEGQKRHGSLRRDLSSCAPGTQGGMTCFEPDWLRWISTTAGRAEFHTKGDIPAVLSLPVDAGGGQKSCCRRYQEMKGFD
jgi:hypothetical protein